MRYTLSLALALLLATPALACDYGDGGVITQDLGMVGYGQAVVAVPQFAPQAPCYGGGAVAIQRQAVVYRAPARQFVPLRAPGGYCGAGAIGRQRFIPRAEVLPSGGGINITGRRVRIGRSFGFR